MANKILKEMRKGYLKEIQKKTKFDPIIKPKLKKFQKKISE